MANPRQWYSQGTLIFFCISTILCIAFCFTIICSPSNQKGGIMTFLFDLLNINLRSVSLSIPTTPDSIPGVVSIISSQAQSVESIAATAASSIVSVVSSAATAVETAAGSISPKNCSLGTGYFCIGFYDHIECKDLPLNISNILPRTVLTASQFSKLETVDRALVAVNSKSIKGCFIMGLAFAILAILPDTISICSVLARQRGLFLFSWISQISMPLRVACTFSCFSSILAPTIIISILLSKVEHLPEEVTIELGEASKQILAAFICVLSMVISIIVRLYLDRHSEDIL